VRSPRPLVAVLASALAGACVLAGAAAGSAAPRAAASTTITIDGSETTLALVADLAYFYRKTQPRPPRFTLTGGGTPLGIADAFRGTVQIGLAARDPGPGDPPSLVFTPAAYSAVCLVTHLSNPVGNVTRATLQGIASGAVATWPAFGGSTRTDAIHLFGFPPGEGAQAVFERVFLDPGTPQNYAPTRVQTSSELRAAVLADPSAFGWVDLAYTRGLNVVRYEGIPCTQATVASGAYPGRRGLNMVTRGQPTGAVARFMRWIRSNSLARRIVTTRYVPARG
jgi:phosphate transport system substrate-binding protein